jgi:hypothetical protein
MPADDEHDPEADARAVAANPLPITEEQEASLLQDAREILNQGQDNQG